MKYLTIDTTTKVTALSLAQDAIYGRRFLHRQDPLERLIPMLDQLNAAAWQLRTCFIGGGKWDLLPEFMDCYCQGLAQVLNIP